MRPISQAPDSVGLFAPENAFGDDDVPQPIVATNKRNGGGGGGGGGGGSAVAAKPSSRIKSQAINVDSFAPIDEFGDVELAALPPSGATQIQHRVFD